MIFLLEVAILWGTHLHNPRCRRFISIYGFALPINPLKRQTLIERRSRAKTCSSRSMKTWYPNRISPTCFARNQMKTWLNPEASTFCVWNMHCCVYPEPKKFKKTQLTVLKGNGLNRATPIWSMSCGPIHPHLQQYNHTHTNMIRHVCVCVKLYSIPHIWAYNPGLLAMAHIDI